MNPTLPSSASNQPAGNPEGFSGPPLYGLDAPAFTLGGIPTDGTTPAAFTDQAVLKAAGYGRAMLTAGRQLVVPVFSDATSDMEVGRAFAGDERALVCQVLNEAAAAFTKAVLDTSRGLYTLSTAGAFPDRDGPIAEVYFTGSDQPADTSWATIFDVRDYRGTTEEDFEIANVRDAVAFRVYAAGERVELYGVTGDVLKFPFALVGGGFQYLETWAMDAKFWRIADGLRAMETAYGVNMARLAYAVLTNASGLTSQTRDATGANVLEKDVNTVNAAATAILADMFTADGFVSTNPSFVLVYNALTPGYPERAAAMAAANYGLANPVLGATRLAYPTRFVSSPYVPTGAFYLVFPKRKLKTGVRMDLTTFEKFDPTVLANARIGWGRYVHVRGDARQVRLIPLS